MIPHPDLSKLPRDEHGRLLLTYSSIKRFRNCRRSFYWRVLRGIVPAHIPKDDPRNWGTAIHRCQQIYYEQDVVTEDGEIIENATYDQKAQIIYDYLARFFEMKDLDAEARDEKHDYYEAWMRAAACWSAYHDRWGKDPNQADHHWEVELLESPFLGDIIHPKTDEVAPGFAAHGQSVPGFAMAGKADGVVRIPPDKVPCQWGEQIIDEPGLYLLEHKTASTINGDYIRRLWADFQIIEYSHYFGDGLGEPIVGVLYNVLGKANHLKHRREETPADFETRKMEAVEQAKSGEMSVRIRQKKDEPDDEWAKRRMAACMQKIREMEPMSRESDEEYANRLNSFYSGGDRFHRSLIVIQPEMRDEILAEVYETTIDFAIACERNRWGKNESNCYAYHRPCDYLPICESLDNPLIIERDFRLKAPHSELADDPPMGDTISNPALPIAR